MRRAQVIFDTRTETLSVQSAWPPYPKKGDRWEKQGDRKLLKRRVTEVTPVGNVTYKDQDGVEKICAVKSFRKWCDDCRARALRIGGKKVVYEEA
ncbi:hypothetical protein LCGC14_3095040 [marine sediment metagenome]|uniref:Uncharacterized protein n=1 Tax=marine sediment metagenome TaxID=412755 RepID=A0A0F8W9H6_9ZZZZ